MEVVVKEQLIGRLAALQAQLASWTLTRIGSAYEDSALTCVRRWGEFLEALILAMPLTRAVHECFSCAQVPKLQQQSSTCAALPRRSMASTDRGGGGTLGKTQGAEADLKQPVAEKGQADPSLVPGPTVP